MQNLVKKEIKYPFLTRPVEVFERENGHKIVLAHKEGGLVNVSTWVKTGSINEDDKINGISHFLEHLMFKGTSKHPAGYFDKTLEAKGAIVNAATWKDYTFYYVTLPKGENCENLNLALELHADMMLDPVLPENELGPEFDIKDTTVKEKRERHVVIEEIRMREDQPWTKVYNAANNAMYTKHPYKRDVIGHAYTIASVPRDTIMDYYKKHYTPNNMTTIVVGDFDHNEVLERVIKEFDFKGRENFENPQFEIDRPSGETKYIENRAQINTGFVIIGYLGEPACALKENIGLEMASIILGEGQSSRLFKNLIERAKEPVFNLVSADFYNFRDGSNLFVQANFDASKKEEAIELLKEEIRKVVEDGIDEKEFEKAKKRLKVNFAEEAETVSEIGETIGYYMTVCNNLELVEEYLEELEKFSIEDFNDVVKKYLPVKNAVISVLMPE